MTSQPIPVKQYTLVKQGVYQKLENLIKQEDHGISVQLIQIPMLSILLAKECLSCNYS